MSMTYDEALEENPIISRDHAKRVCELHRASFDELMAELGDHAEYEAAKLLGWLGY